MLLSPRLGRTSSKEQYAYFYRYAFLSNAPIFTENKCTYVLSNFFLQMDCLIVLQVWLLTCTHTVLGAHFFKIGFSTLNIQKLKFYMCSYLLKVRPL